MSKPKHQHFIPKSYLKNFSEEKDSKYFVEAKLRDEETPKKSLISIRDICVDKNIYTLPHKQGDEKYALEEYYAREIDEVYPEVYELLVNSEIKKINEKQRIQIIMTTMSLFFRTPKFLNYQQNKTNQILNYAVRNHTDKHGKVKFNFKGQDLNFNVEDLEEVRTKLKIENKVKFLNDHLSDWHKFTNFKLYAAIGVTHVNDDIDLITSDNPVIMHSVINNPFSVFDPTNIIELPLDNKNYLIIFPNTEESILNEIYRIERNKWFALTTNLQVEKNCEEWIIGKPNSVKAHILDQAKYGEHTPENFKYLEDIKAMAEGSNELLVVMTNHGFFSEQTIAKVNEMLKIKVHNDDPEFQRICHELESRGIKLNRQIN